MVNNESNEIFNKIEQNSNLSVEEIYKVAQSIQHADFSDERTVRQIVRNLSQLTNRTISQDKEDTIVNSIITNEIPNDIQSLQQFLK